MKSFLKSITLGVAALAITAAVCAPSLRAAEILDNGKVIKAVSAGVSLVVILNQITAANTNCRFDASNDAIIEIQKAGKEGGWKPEDVKVLQKRVIEVAGLDQKRLKELVDTAQNIWENADPNEYDLMMRKLMKEGKTVVPYLLKQLEQESERKRAGNVDALGHIGDKSDEVVRVINMALVDRSKPVRLQTAKTVAALANDGTVADLVSKLNNRNEKLDGVAMALGYLGDSNQKAIDALTKVLHASGDSDARVCSAWSLGQLRAKSPNAIDALLEAVLDDRDEKLRDSAALALAIIGDKRTPSYIMKAFERFRTPGRADLIKHLSYFKDPAGIVFLIEQTDSDVTDIKKSAVETLRVISGENLETTEEWHGWWAVAQARPDFRGNGEGQKIPDAGGNERTQKRSDNVDPIDTSAR